MNLSLFASGGAVYVNRECVSGFAFKQAAVWDKCALLPGICAGFGGSQDNCAHFSPIECLLPQSVTAC